MNKKKNKKNIAKPKCVYFLCNWVSLISITFTFMNAKISQKQKKHVIKDLYLIQTNLIICMYIYKYIYYARISYI